MALDPFVTLQAKPTRRGASQGRPRPLAVAVACAGWVLPLFAAGAADRRRALAPAGDAG